MNHKIVLHKNNDTNILLGIYISEKNKSLPKEYQGIGIRIEDDVLITVNGPVVLSRKCPKHVDEIEKLVSQNN